MRLTITLTQRQAACLAKLSQCVSFGGCETTASIYAGERYTPLQMRCNDAEAVAKAVVDAYRAAKTEAGKVKKGKKR